MLSSFNANSLGENWPEIPSAVLDVISFSTNTFGILLIAHTLERNLMSKHIDVLLLLALPASGKSEAPGRFTTRCVMSLIVVILAAAWLPGMAVAEGIGEAAFVGGAIETLPAIFEQVEPCIASAPDDGRITLAAWEDHRSGDADIFAARIDSAGALLDPIGIPVALGSAEQVTPAVAYGAGLFSENCTMESFSSRFHGNDERIDIESLALTTQMWLGVAERFWDIAAS